MQFFNAGTIILEHEISPRGVPFTELSLFISGNGDTMAIQGNNTGRIEFDGPENEVFRFVESEWGGKIKNVEISPERTDLSHLAR